MRKRLLRFILIIILILLFKELFTWLYISFNNGYQVNSYYNNDTSFNYKNNMVINISKINLKTVVRPKGDNFKNLNKGLVYYDSSNYKEKIIIFGHSGVGYGTYFNRIDELKKGDLLYLYKDKLKITYKVNKIYNIYKTNINILNNDKEGELLLITCDKTNKNTRLIVQLSVKNVKTLKK